MYNANDVISTQEVTSKADDMLQKGSKTPIFIVPHMNLSSLIIKTRQKRGVPQKEFAELLGLPPSELCRLEKKSPRLSRKMLRRLSPFIGIPYSTLLANSGYSEFSETINDYYTENGRVIDGEKIIADIYAADSKLLEDLSDIQNTLSYDDVQFLRSIIYLLKVKNIMNDRMTPNSNHDDKSKDESGGVIQAMIHSLIQYVTNQVSLLINFYKRTLRV